MIEQMKKTTVPQRIKQIGKCEHKNQEISNQKLVPCWTQTDFSHFNINLMKNDTAWSLFSPWLSPD